MIKAGWSERSCNVAQGEKIIGIDLGTTNSVVAVMRAGKSKSSRTRKAIVSRPASLLLRTKESDWSATGQTASDYQFSPDDLLESQRFMGRRHNEVQAEEKLVPYKIVGGPTSW